RGRAGRRRSGLGRGDAGCVAASSSSCPWCTGRARWARGAHLPVPVAATRLLAGRRLSMTTHLSVGSGLSVENSAVGGNSAGGGMSAVGGEWARGGTGGRRDDRGREAAVADVVAQHLDPERDGEEREGPPLEGVGRALQVGVGPELLDRGG